MRKSERGNLASTIRKLEQTFFLRTTRILFHRKHAKWHVLAYFVDPTAPHGHHDDHKRPGSYRIVRDEALKTGNGTHAAIFRTQFV